MRYYKYIFITLAFCAAATGASAQKLSLAEISTYFNNLTSIVSDFEQINSDGSVSTGKFYLIRPAQARFQYDGGADASFVLIAGGQVGIYDAKSNDAPRRFPLSQTPLATILRNNVDLETTGLVIDHRDMGGKTVLTLQDPEYASFGFIQLAFDGTDANNVQLEQWVIIDNAGSATQFRLKNWETNAKIDPLLFNVQRALRLWSER